MFTSFKRIIKWGLKNFWRNGWLSTATVSIMTLTLLVITVLLMVNVVANAVLANLQSKIDISVYFRLDTSEDDILKVKSQLEKLQEVESTTYVSQNEALLNFKEKHKDNPVLLQSLEELEFNPLEASLNVKAKETNQYTSINQFLESVYYKDLIDKVNYLQNKEVIEKLGTIITDVKTGGFGLSILLALIVFLVTFNAIRLAIYSSRRNKCNEISRSEQVVYSRAVSCRGTALWFGGHSCDDYSFVSAFLFSLAEDFQFPAYR